MSKRKHKTNNYELEDNYIKNYLHKKFSKNN